MRAKLQISAKNLGEVAKADFCPRCFWLKLHVKPLPFQIFPGIFSSIDAYTKKVLHTYIDQHAALPPWLGALGEANRYYTGSVHYSKFNWVDEATDILLTGTPDDIFLRPNDEVVIVDYKTAKYTKNADSLLPIYETQLNVYALIAESLGVKPVVMLALAYMEPVTAEGDASQPRNIRDDGFAMGFTAHIHAVELRPEMIPPLLVKTREIYDLPKPPDGRSECKDCAALDKLIHVLTL